MDQWSQIHQRAEGAQWCLGVHGRERCGCGWAASCHHKCWWPHAATTSLDCSVQPNGTSTMDFIGSLWELPWIPELRYHLIGGPEGLSWASLTPPSWQHARVSGDVLQRHREQKQVRHLREGIRSESSSFALNWRSISEKFQKYAEMLSNNHRTCCPWFLPPGSRPYCLASLPLGSTVAGEGLLPLGSNAARKSLASWQLSWISSARAFLRGPKLCRKLLSSLALSSFTSWISSARAFLRGPKLCRKSVFSIWGVSHSAARPGMRKRCDDASI